MTLGQLRDKVVRESLVPTFIKPAVETKAFAGSVVRTESDVNKLMHLSDELELSAAEPVEMVSEWRYFVHRGTVVGIAHYAGDWKQQPTPATVIAAVSEYEKAPVAYAIDFAVSKNGKTILVEANDAYALGAYGLDAVAFASMLEDRWLEITQGKSA